MADSGAFDWLCGELEVHTTLDKLEARGTVRLALKQAGLDARTVTPEHMAVVVERILPGELTARGVEDSERVCGELQLGLGTLDVAGSEESPDVVFGRLAN